MPYMLMFYGSNAGHPCYPENLLQLGGFLELDFKSPPFLLDRYWQRSVRTAPS